MLHPAMPRTARFVYRQLAVFSFLGLSALVCLIGDVWQTVAADNPKSLTVDEVKALQKVYESERQAAETSGLTKKFSPDWYGRADAFAAKGKQLQENAAHLQEAYEEFKKARWQLPSLPTDLPEHVARIFGDAKLRHNHVVESLAFSPDGKYLVTASDDGIVKVWDAPTGRDLRTYRGHKDKVSTVAVSSDNKTVASAGSERTGRLSDLTTW